MTRASDPPLAKPASTIEGRDPRATPAMQQHARMKAQHPECVLFFRMGDFYEMFDEDAILCNKVLGITLTQRTAGVPMAGVPYHSVEGYLRRMIEQGHRVAVCEQVQDPRQAAGVIERAVTRVLTPGTLVDEPLLDETQANTIAAIQFLQTGDASDAVLALAELSTGRFSIIDLPGGRVADELARIGPSELLYVETADGNVPPRVEAIRAALNCPLTARPTWTFRQSDARNQLLEHFGVMNLDGFGLTPEDPGIGPAGAVLRYLLETQPADVPQGRRLAHLRPPRKESSSGSIAIDAASLRSLEIERTMRTGGTEGSVLWVFQKCRTSMGKRLLRQWLCFPLADRARIEIRQNAVGHLLGDADASARLHGEIERVQDVARIVGRIAMGRATPRDVVALGVSLSIINALAASLEGRAPFAHHHTRLAALAASLAPLAVAITERCIDAPPTHLREGGLFRDGIDAELDEARGLQRDGNSWLAAYQKQLVDQTAIGSLKVGYNNVFGYYIEITHAHVEKIPPTFTRKQTLKNAERYITPELKEFEDKVTTAEARAIEREKLLFDRLCRQATGLAPALAEFADIIAELDVLATFADLARRNSYIRPHMVDEPILDIRQGRHPVLDRTLGERFVPNDCVLGTTAGGAAAAPESDLEQPGSRNPEPQSALALITGPNMAGKSTFIRQVALIVLLAHTGSFVPAEAATIGMVDRIFTRIGSSDELHAGQSTFMVEMTETANILHHATGRSLVILDEIGRGTSTLDGLSLAWAIAESIAAIGCRTLFATHYHEITGLAERLPGVTNLHVAVREWVPAANAPGHEQIIFLYRILPGRTDRSYGIHVAKIAGLPRPTVKRAGELLETLAVHTQSTVLPPDMQPRTPAAGAQMSLFTEYLDHPAIGELRKLDLNAMTPIQAFDALRKLASLVKPER